MHHFAYRPGVSHNNVLHAEEVDLADLAAAVGTPFYCYSSATLERHYRVFADAFAAAPGTLVCYSVKANSNLGVLATLARLGAGMDVVSEGELRRALAVKVPPERIVFSGVGKTRAEMAFALEAGIFAFNVESEDELQGAERGRRCERTQRAYRHSRQSRCRRQDPPQDRHRQSREQVRRAIRRGPCPVRAGDQPARHRALRRAYAYRQPDHRPGAVPQRLRAAEGAGRQSARRRRHYRLSSISAAGSASPIATTSRRRRYPRIMPSSSRLKSAASACVCCSSRAA